MQGHSMDNIVVCAFFEIVSEGPVLKIARERII